jgi:phosphoesterase RecJ-like protein
MVLKYSIANIIIFIPKIMFNLINLSFFKFEKLNKNIINKIKELIQDRKRIAIITHANPDGDALGASLALYGILIQQKHQVTVVSPNEFPSFLAWMPYSEKVVIHKKDPVKASKIINNADIIFCLDFNDIKRIEKMEKDYTRSKAIKILIDHHLDTLKFTDYTLSETKTSSTSEIVYDLLIDLNKKSLINKSVAECLYVGIVTDTGSFSYSCNYQKTYLIIAELFNLGIDGERIHQLVYDTYSENRLRLLGYCLSEKLKVFHKYHTAYISLTKADLKKFNYKIGDTEGVVNYALSIDGVSMAALFMERDGNIKISMRSAGNISVNDICRKYYYGGGHRNAAGGNSYKSMKETLKDFKKLLTVITHSK